MIDENTLQGTGRKVGSERGGMILQIEKKVESAGALNAYIYLIIDAKLKSQKVAFVSTIY